MFEKPCPACGRPTNTPQFWLPHRWRGRPCPQCKTRIGLPKANSALVVGALPLIIVIFNTDGLPNYLKALLFAAIVVAVGLLELRSDLVVSPARKR